MESIRPVPARGNVLVVDDDPDGCAALARALSDEGFDVRVAADGELALVELRRRLPDAVVSDLHMPNIDGLQLLRRARAEHPELIVVLMSGDRSRPATAFSDGAVTFLTKPVDVDELVTILDSSLQFRRERTGDR